MAIVTCGYHKNVAMTYTTIATAVAGTSDGDTILLFNAADKGRSQWALYYMTAARNFIGVYPNRGVQTNSIGLRYAGILENLTMAASTAYPAVMCDTAASTSQVRCCALQSIYTAGAAYASVAAGDYTFVNCAALGGSYTGFANAATATLVMRTVNCTATFCTTKGFGQGHLTNGSHYMYNNLAFKNLGYDMGNIVFTGGARCAYGDSGLSTTYLANILGAYSLPIVDENKIGSWYDDQRFGMLQAHRMRPDAAVHGMGVRVPGYSLEYDIDYRPWQGGQPSIGCCGGVDLKPKMRKGVFGRNKLAYRVGDYVHPDAPWIKYAGYLN